MSDDDLVSDFIAEMTERLSGLGQLDDRALPEAALRIVHTIRGTCGFLGLSCLEALALACERMLSALCSREQNATPECISLVSEALSRIRALIDHLSLYGQDSEGSDAHLIARLEAFAETGVGEETPPAFPADGDRSGYFRGDADLAVLIAEQESTRLPPARSVRMDPDALERLARDVGELAAAHDQITQIVQRRGDADLLPPIRHLGEVTSALRQRMMMLCPGKGDMAALADHAAEDTGRTQEYLLFRSGGSLQAVTLEQVSHVEKIDVAAIEVEADAPVVRYRGEALRLIAPGQPNTLPNAGWIRVIVLSPDVGPIGLVIEEAVDIVHAERSPRPITVAGLTADILDVSQLSVFTPNAPIATGEIAPDTYDAARHRVLLVDDSPFFRNLMESCLGAAGYDVTAVAHAGEALEMLAASPERFSAIMTDLEMPGVEGVDLGEACRTSPALARIPVIAYAASMPADALRRCMEAGVREYVLKTDRKGLLKAMARHLAAEERVV